jgi:hypothetical protein
MRLAGRFVVERALLNTVFSFAALLLLSDREGLQCDRPAHRKRCQMSKNEQSRHAYLPLSCSTLLAKHALRPLGARRSGPPRLST